MAAKCVGDSPCLSSLVAPAVPPLTQTPGSAAASKRCCADGCRKKLGLLDFACRCGKIHCAAHRHAEAHGCQYDYQADHAKVLQKTIGEAVVAKKIDQI